MDEKTLYGAAYEVGIYLSSVSSLSGYSGIVKGQHKIHTKQELVKHYNCINTLQQMLFPTWYSLKRTY
ncbi:hypothetical protein UPYG_G00270280 [Umbra pygmaea]|uniref:Uncharacterized protein n=1 Tax=Umbra pygmaea TaxID=75934 RepID=A0ABD0WV16_UMBPY